MIAAIRRVGEGETFAEYERYLPLVPPERREKIARLRSERKKLVSLLTGLLIRDELSSLLRVPGDELRFGYGEYGKPYLPDFPDLRFSVSHSGGGIAFACGSAPIGIDMERIGKADMRIAQRFFTERERGLIASSADANGAFFRIWTAKEAYVKLLGTGLHTPLDSFDVTCAPGVRFDSLPLPGFAVTICRAAG